MNRSSDMRRLMESLEQSFNWVLKAHNFVFRDRAGRGEPYEFWRLRGNPTHTIIVDAPRNKWFHFETQLVDGEKKSVSKGEGEGFESLQQYLSQTRFE